MTKGGKKPVVNGMLHVLPQDAERRGDGREAGPSKTTPMENRQTNPADTMHAAPWARKASSLLRVSRENGYWFLIERVMITEVDMIVKYHRQSVYE